METGVRPISGVVNGSVNVVDMNGKPAPGRRVVVRLMQQPAGASQEDSGSIFATPAPTPDPATPPPPTPPPRVLELKEGETKFSFGDVPPGHVWIEARVEDEQGRFHASSSTTRIYVVA